MSDEELAKASSENPLDLTAAISNSTIYNPTQTSLPKGWSENRKATGNNNRTENTGDSQLEGWSGDKLNVKYLIIALVLIGHFADRVLPYALPWGLSAAFVGLGLYYRNHSEIFGSVGKAFFLCITLDS